MSQFSHACSDFVPISVQQIHNAEVIVFTIDMTGNDYQTRDKLLLFTFVADSFLLFLLLLIRLASCPIHAQPLPAHRPTADDNSFIGCTRPRPDRWLVAAQCPFRWQLMPISGLVWMRSFIKPHVLKTMYRSTITLWFIWSICSGK